MWCGLLPDRRCDAARISAAECWDCVPVTRGSDDRAAGAPASDAIALDTETIGDRTSANETFVERVAELNVMLVKRQIMQRSPLLARMVRSSEIAIVGGMYDVESGAVEFYDARMLHGAA